MQAVVYIEKILKTQRVPIIVGGSNSYIEKLVEDPVFMFKYKYDSWFIWIDVEQSVLNRRVDMRVDQMVKAGNFCNYSMYQYRYTIMQLAKDFSYIIFYFWLSNICSTK